MSENHSQSVWMGLSFLAVGLMGGILFTNGGQGFANLFDGSQATDDSVEEAAPDVDPDSLEIVAVSVDDDAVMGDPDAPVTIVEFSDFQCPYCEKFYTETLPLIKENYIDTGKVKLIYRDLPLPSHDKADDAAEAAECFAEAGGDYYAYHDWLFENVAAWANEDVTGSLIAGAQELGFDISACLENGDMQDEVNADYTAGKSYGVTGTPSFFINGKKLVGAWPYDVFESVIESQL